MVSVSSTGVGQSPVSSSSRPALLRLPHVDGPDDGRDAAQDDDDLAARPCSNPSPTRAARPSRCRTWWSPCRSAGRTPPRAWSHRECLEDRDRDDHDEPPRDLAVALLDAVVLLVGEASEDLSLVLELVVFEFSVRPSVRSSGRRLSAGLSRNAMIASSSSSVRCSNAGMMEPGVTARGFAVVHVVPRLHPVAAGDVQQVGRLAVGSEQARRLPLDVAGERRLPEVGPVLGLLGQQGCGTTSTPRG